MTGQNQSDLDYFPHFYNNRFSLPVSQINGHWEFTMANQIGLRSWKVFAISESGFVADIGIAMVVGKNRTANY